jgi:hypothetical protein
LALTKNDTAGKFAEPTTLKLATSATTPGRAAVPTESAGLGLWTGGLSSSSHRVKTSPAVSKMRESQLWVHIASISLSHGLADSAWLSAA